MHNNNCDLKLKKEFHTLTSYLTLEQNNLHNPNLCHIENFRENWHFQGK